MALLLGGSSGKTMTSKASSLTPLENVDDDDDEWLFDGRL